MKKPQVGMSKSAYRMKAYSKVRADALHRELETFLAHPRADEILLNEWLYDASLPAPSAELLEYFSNDILYNPEKYLRYISAEDKGANDTIRNHVLELDRKSVV